MTSNTARLLALAAAAMVALSAGAAESQTIPNPAPANPPPAGTPASQACINALTAIGQAMPQGNNVVSTTYNQGPPPSCTLLTVSSTGLQTTGQFPSPPFILGRIQIVCSACDPAIMTPAPSNAAGAVGGGVVLALPAK